MRTLSMVLLVLAAPLAPAQQKVDIHMRAIPAPSVRLGGAVSSVRVIGWDHDSIAVTGALSQGSRMDGGPFNGNSLVVGMKFFVDAPDESALRGNKLELRVPRNARVWIKAGSADIEASGVTGGLDLNIVGGSVRVTGRPRELIVESMDGAVDVSGFVSYGRLKTATGDVTFRGTGEDMTVATVSGTIRVGDGSVERARFESVTGPIVFAADLVRGGDTRFDTHSGAIELRLSKKAEVEIDASSVTGSIENAWSGRRAVIGREGRGMELGVSSGMGGARVSVRSFKGNIKLTSR